MSAWQNSGLTPNCRRNWRHGCALSSGTTLHAVRDLGLRNADDRTIFLQARSANAVLLSKDVDFVALVGRLGSPPKLIWLTCGNVSNEALRILLSLRLDPALKVLENEDVVEVA